MARRYAFAVLLGSIGGALAIAVVNSIWHVIVDSGVTMTSLVTNVLMMTLIGFILSLPLTATVGLLAAVVLSKRRLNGLGHYLAAGSAVSLVTCLAYLSVRWFMKDSPHLLSFPTEIELVGVGGMLRGEGGSLAELLLTGPAIAGLFWVGVRHAP